MARQPGLHHALVLIDQSQLRQRQRELHASHQQSLTRLPHELLNGLPQIPAHELRVPIDPVQGARHDVLLCRVDRPGEGFHPIRPRSRPRRRPPRCLHHFVGHPAKEEGIGLVEVLDRVTMQVFVREHCTMIAAPVQCDVDVIPKGSHYVRVPPMIGEKYIGLDVHQATISVAVMDSKGKVVMESILETQAATILEFFAGLRGTLWVTFEEGTWAAWLYDLLKPHVAKLVVCNPRKNALLKDGNKSDRIDARKLAELLRLDNLTSVYHGETGVRMLRELARSYLTIVKDLSRVMNRLKALYRSWAIPCAGRDVYYTRHRSEWLGKIREAGTRRRAEQLYQQLDMLQHLRQQARRELLAVSRKHTITAKLRQIPSLGPIRSALAVALIQTPHRFRTKRQLWAYSGLALETRTSGEHRYVRGQLRRSKKQVSIRGLNKDHNHDLKGLFKAAATRASVQPGPFQDFYQRSLAKGIKPTMVRLTLARKIAAITLTLWKKGENFDAEKLKSQAA